MLEPRIAHVHRTGQMQWVRVVNFVAKGTIEEHALRSLSTGILDGGSGEISLGGFRLTRFMKEVENVAGWIGPVDIIAPKVAIQQYLRILGSRLAPAVVRVTRKSHCRSRKSPGVWLKPCQRRQMSCATLGLDRARYNDFGTESYGRRREIMAVSRIFAQFLPSALLRYAERLRFPQLFLVTLMLFVLDTLLPDLIPFIDEILLGLATLLIGSIRKRRMPPSQSVGP